MAIFYSESCLFFPISHSATLLGDRLVVFGGWDAPICFNDLHVLDLGTVVKRIKKIFHNFICKSMALHPFSGFLVPVINLNHVLALHLYIFSVTFESSYTHITRQFLATGLFFYCEEFEL